MYASVVCIWPQAKEKKKSLLKDKNRQKSKPGVQERRGKQIQQGIMEECLTPRLRHTDITGSNLGG